AKPEGTIFIFCFEKSKKKKCFNTFLLRGKMRIQLLMLLMWTELQISSSKLSLAATPLTLHCLLAISLVSRQNTFIFVLVLHLNTQQQHAQICQSKDDDLV